MDKINDKTKFDQLDALIIEYKDQKGPLMPVMQQAQDIFGYLPFEVQSTIAKGLGLPLTEVYGVATFYSQFSMEPKGEHIVSVCLGTACYVRGADKLMDKLVEELGIAEGATTADRKFTLLGTRCLGCCGLAPVLMIDDAVHGNLDADMIPGIMNTYR